MKTKTKTAESQNQFTPGPWHINTLEVVPFSIHSHRGVVAEVSRGTMNEVKADEIEANARLIAAAPDLLAACEAALMGTAFDESWRDKCHSAIAKARGEKS